MGNTLQKLPEYTPPPQTQTEEKEEQFLEEFTCEICIEPASNQFKNGDNCSHPFCTDCIISYIRVKLDNDNVGHITCPALLCYRALDPFKCATLVGEPLFVRWCDVLCEAALVNHDKCYCPYRNCNLLILNECGESPMKSECPSCKRLYCFQCKSVWHAGFTCGENWARRDGNDVALARLAERRRWKSCPRCRHLVELREGCNTIRCRCGIEFCYVCGKQVYYHLCSCQDKKYSMYCCSIFSLLVILFILIFAVFLPLYSHFS